MFHARDARILSVLDFYRPGLKRLTLESEYERELFREMKRIRELARQKIKKAQDSQKHQYDKGAKESRIGVGDLVMLKVDPKFKLDRNFHGPYRVHGVTSTSARIQLINNPDLQTNQNMQHTHFLRSHGAVTQHLDYHHWPHLCFVAYFRIHQINCFFLAQQLFSVSQLAWLVFLGLFTSILLPWQLS